MPENSSNRDSQGDGNYVVVARRYRPRGFDELVGQAHVGQALKNAIETNRVGHAYLFTGARGVGKTSAARIFAKALNDPSGPTVSPDNASDVALAIDAGEDVDVIEIDGASNRGIDEIRSLRANVGVRPSRSKFKIYIIDEVHMLTAAAFNALLKTLEEPPEHVKFIFCTTDPEKIPITVLSRCQRFDFAPVEVPKIVGRLREIVTAESAEADDAALELIARRAAGSMRDSQSLLEQVLSFSDGSLTADQVHAMLGTADDERLHSLAKAMADRDAAEAMRQMDASVDAGVDAGRLAEQLLGYFRDLMAVTVGCDHSLLRHTSASLFDELKELGDHWGLQTVLAVVGLLDETLVRIRLSVHSRVLLEATLIQICSLPDLQSVADLAAAASQSGGSAGKPGQDKAGQKKKLSSELRDSRPQNVESRAAEATSDSPPVSTPTPIAESQSDDATSSESITATVSSPHGDVAVLEPETATAVATLDEVAAEPAPTRQAIQWNQQAAERVWKETLEALESMTETFARVVESVQAMGDQKLRLMFPADGALAMKRCELPEHKGAILDAVTRAAGQAITLEFQCAPSQAPVQKSVPSEKSKPSRLQRMREIEANELVKSCVELFDAEIVRIDKPS